MESIITKDSCRKDTHTNGKIYEEHSYVYGLLDGMPIDVKKPICYENSFVKVVVFSAA